MLKGVNVVEHLALNTISGIKFDLHFKSNNTILEGESATGKSYLFQILSEYKDSSLTKNEILSSALLVNYQNAIELDDIKNSNGRLIVIDNADIILPGRQDIEDRINRGWPNQYLIMSRGALGLAMPPGSHAQLLKSGNVFILDYRKW